MLHSFITPRLSTPHNDMARRTLQPPAKRPASYSRPGSPAPDRRKPIDFDRMTKASPKACHWTALMGTIGAPLRILFEKLAISITPPDSESVKDDICFVLSQKEPSFLRRMFTNPMSNTRLGSPDTRKAVVYEFVFPLRYRDVQVYNKPWQSAAKFPNYYLCFDKPGSSTRYRFEPFILLREASKQPRCGWEDHANKFAASYRTRRREHAKATIRHLNKVTSVCGDEGSEAQCAEFVL